MANFSLNQLLASVILGGGLQTAELRDSREDSCHKAFVVLVGRGCRGLCLVAIAAMLAIWMDDGWID